MDPQITDDPTHNERSAIAWLTQENDRLMAEVADLKVVVNFLLAKVHADKVGRLNLVRELRKVHGKLDNLRSESQYARGELVSRSALLRANKLEAAIRQNLGDENGPSNH